MQAHTTTSPCVHSCRPNAHALGTCCLCACMTQSCCFSLARAVLRRYCLAAGFDQPNAHDHWSLLADAVVDRIWDSTFIQTTQWYDGLGYGLQCMRPMSRVSSSWFSPRLDYIVYRFLLLFLCDYPVHKINSIIAFRQFFRSHWAQNPSFSNICVPLEY